MKTLALFVLAAGCGDLSNFGGTAPPLATITIDVTGDFDAVHLPDTGDPDLYVAVVWGEQWFPEPICFLPPESPEVEALVAAGCRNPLGFTPSRTTDVAPLVLGQPVSLAITDLPAADLMVGTVDARVGYASFVVFDDRDHDGVMQLPRPQRLFMGQNPNGPEPEPDPPPFVTVAYGASFVAMTEPDTRLAFREGDFNESGFYPRHGCGDPLPAFSLLSAGGFSFAEALAATAAGMLPSQDPATCSESPATDVHVTIPLRAPAEVGEAVCEQRRDDSSVRYREPPSNQPPELIDRTIACASIPNLGGDPIAPEGTVQLLVSSRPDEACKSITHFTLFGCDENTNLMCDQYEWDYRANPPSWWPCPVTR